MVEQRCREPRRHLAGRGRRRCRLEVLGVVALLVLGACSGDPVEPRPDEPGGNHTGTSGGGPSASIVGGWQTVVVIQVPGDLQTWTTTWRFESDGSCRQTVVTESLAEGFPRTTERTCSFTINGSTIVISYGGGGELTFEFSFAGFSPDRLILDGFEYQRIA